jgi:hypothetical protein
MLPSLPSRLGTSRRERRDAGAGAVEWIVVVVVLVAAVALIASRSHSVSHPKVVTMPAWVPSYPGAQPTLESSGSTQTRIMEDVRFETRDLPPAVLDFFDRALTGSGFVVDRVERGAGHLSAVHCPTLRRVNVYVQAGKGGATEVRLGYVGDQPGWGPSNEPAREATLPAWVPGYPGARLLADPSRSNDRYKYWTAHFETFDSPKNVLERYAAVLAMPGFTVAISWSYASDPQLGGRVTATAAGDKRRIDVEMHPNPVKGCPSKVEVSWHGVAEQGAPDQESARVRGSAGAVASRREK